MDTNMIWACVGIGVFTLAVLFYEGARWMYNRLWRKTLKAFLDGKAVADANTLDVETFLKISRIVFGVK
jgi:hypothetical protein